MGLFVRALFVLLVFCGCGRPDSLTSQAGFCSVGSEGFNVAMDAWAELYAGRHTGDPRFLHEGRGNGTAPQSLLRNLCALGPMTRPMSDAEVDAFVREFGAVPGVLPVAIEALAVVVPREFPIDAVSTAQVEQIFHELPEDMALVFPGLRIASRISPEAFGVNSAMDRFRWFKRVALGGRKFSDRITEVRDPLTLVDRVGASAAGFGYARPAELTNRVKGLGVRVASGEIVRAESASILSGDYPYARYYYIYLPPKRKLEARLLQFLELVLGSDGQAVLSYQGLFPLSVGDRAASLGVLEGYR